MILEKFKKKKKLKIPIFFFYHGSIAKYKKVFDLTASYVLREAVCRSNLIISTRLEYYSKELPYQQENSKALHEAELRGGSLTSFIQVEAPSEAVSRMFDASRMFLHSYVIREVDRFLQLQSDLKRYK